MAMITMWNRRFRLFLFFGERVFAENPHMAVHLRRAMK
jgi:hypothetical protein